MPEGASAQSSLTGCDLIMEIQDLITKVKEES
jgi:hypothetical protein